MELARAVGGMGSAAAQARENALSTGMLRSMMEDHENAVKRIEELESLVNKLQMGRAYPKADSDLARRQYEAVSGSWRISRLSTRARGKTSCHRNEL